MTTTTLRIHGRKLLNATLLTSLLALQISCAKSGGLQNSAGSSSSSSQSSSSGSSGNSTSSGPGGGVQQAYVPVPLAWESTSHPERAAWSSTLEQIVSAHLSVLNTAKDIVNFCPKYAQLSDNQKINLWADLFAADSYYESGWNPADYSVDVGTQNDDNTWSVGLLQMSVVDQANYKLPMGYTFADLQTPGPNLDLGVQIMALQIQKHGTVLINSGSSGLYWSTLSPGGKYDQSANIEKMTKQLSFCQ